MSTPFLEELFKKDDSNGFAVASMVLGIVSLVCAMSCCCMGLICCFFMVLSAVVGLVLGIISLLQHKDGFNMAVAGVIMCSISIVLAIMLVVLMMIGNFSISSEQLRRFFRQSNNYV